MSSPLSMNQSNKVNDNWKNLFRIGGLSGILIALFIPLQTIIFIIYPPPTTTLEWFNLFQNNRIVGLLDMDLLLIIDQLLLGFIILALYIKLRYTDQSFSFIAVVLGLMGIITYFSSTVAFDMLTLSDKYAAATTEAEKSALLTSGQTMLTTWTGTSFDIGYFLLGLSILIIGLIMYKSSEFSKLTSYFGIAAGILSLIPASFGLIGLLFAFLSLIPLEIWVILIAKNLLS